MLNATVTSELDADLAKNKGLNTSAMMNELECVSEIQSDNLSKDLNSDIVDEINEREDRAPFTREGKSPAPAGGVFRSSPIFNSKMKEDSSVSVSDLSAIVGRK